MIGKLLIENVLVYSWQITSVSVGSVNKTGLNVGITAKGFTS